MRHEISRVVRGTETAIDVGGVEMRADLTVPPAPLGVVVFAHGSGSGRHSPRNRLVAAVLQEANLVTLLADLLSEEEAALDAHTGRLRFDIPLLARRLVGLSDWLLTEPRTSRLRLGYFGASTGAAAALVAAADRPGQAAAIVSRGGRPDLAGDALRYVRAPTLLIVGGQDPRVLELNREALAALTVEKELVVIPGAGHLFEEPGTLERVAALARDWFIGHLASDAAPEAPAPASGP